MTMQPLENVRDLMIAAFCTQVVTRDASSYYEVGHRFDFDVLDDPRAKGVRKVTERIFENLCLLDFGEVSKTAPFEIVYIAKGAPADIVVRNAEGEHLCLPSGLLAVLDRCREGDFPPSCPGDDVEDRRSA